MKLKTFILVLLTFNLILYSSVYKLRKYNNVKEFYKEILPIAIEVSTEYNMPPAALLAIAGLESGYGSGYIYKISGNILSLGTMKGDKELPPLTMWKDVDNGKVYLDSLLIPKNRKVILEKRPPSLKKDYRPDNIAGTEKDLLYFSNHKASRDKAIKKCMEDFCKYLISLKSKAETYRQAKIFLNNLIKSKGKEELYKNETSETFISMIGGKPRSFNVRESWVKKVSYILNECGLSELVNETIKGKKFDEVW